MVLCCKINYIFFLIFAVHLSCTVHLYNFCSWCLYIVLEMCHKSHKCNVRGVMMYLLFMSYDTLFCVPVMEDVKSSLVLTEQVVV